MISETSARVQSISTCLVSVIKKELEWYVVQDNVNIKLNFLINVLDEYELPELSEQVVHIKHHLAGVINTELLARCLVEMEEIQKAINSEPYILTPVEFDGKFKLNLSRYLCGGDLFSIS
jgi:hypothetical protein